MVSLVPLNDGAEGSHTEKKSKNWTLGHPKLQTIFDESESSIFTCWYLSVKYEAIQSSAIPVIQKKIVQNNGAESGDQSC